MTFLNPEKTKAAYGSFQLVPIMTIRFSLSALSARTPIVRCSKCTAIDVKSKVWS